jgi:hypothetical protein
MERYALLLTLLALSAARRRSTNIACAPLDAASGEPARVCAPAVRPPAHRLNDSYRLRWLHAPKTGTSLANALFHVACPELPGAAAMPKTQRDAVERGVPRPRRISRAFGGDNDETHEVRGISGRKKIKNRTR